MISLINHHISQMEIPMKEAIVISQQINFLNCLFICRKLFKKVFIRHYVFHFVLQ